MLMGPPISDRATDRTVTALESHIKGIKALLPKVYGASEECRQAQMEFQSILSFPANRDGAWCRRAALLFALSREKELADYFADQERKLLGDGRPTYAEDMRDRVLPFVLPRYLRHSCQAPDTFVVLSLVLAEMWEGEVLGNWPAGAGVPGLAQ